MKQNKLKVVTDGLTGRGMKAWLDGIEIENLLDVDIELGAEKFTEVTLTLLAEVDVELDVDPILIHNGFRRFGRRWVEANE